MASPQDSAGTSSQEKMNVVLELEDLTNDSHLQSSTQNLHQPAQPPHQFDDDIVPGTITSPRPKSWSASAGQQQVLGETQYLSGAPLTSLVLGLTMAAFLLMIDSTILVTVSLRTSSQTQQLMLS
jgi:hypothetical protein